MKPKRVSVAASGVQEYNGSDRPILGAFSRVSILRSALPVLAFLCLETGLEAQSPPPPPPPPPPPSASSMVGDTVTNPATGTTTTVSGLLTDPASAPTAGDTAFVQTADGYAFLVKTVGEKVYNKDVPPLAFTLVSIDTTTHVAQLDADPPGGPLGDLETQLLDADLQAQFFGEETPGVVTPPVVVAGASGVKVVRTGEGGKNGRAGALFVPPSSGGDGKTGPTVDYTNTTVVSTNKIGVEVGSVGGQGGKGGNSYLSFWSGRDGGDGGKGGTVKLINATDVQVATTGTGSHGIFAYSRSGKAGDGGSGFAAPGGGTGGHSADGGSVTVTNQGKVITTGAAAYGIYGLSVSNNGGNGGSQWGLVGKSGSGGFGGSGGPVSITNDIGGTINTSGTLAHGILAQSIGGSGGSSGTSGNLLVSLNGSGDNGGNGGSVTVTNHGLIATTGAQARGIFAQSIGGGGGTGGSSGGLIALGGSGSNGGSAGTVRVTNSSAGVISTAGTQSDGIFAQSVGGSGGSAFGTGGLVAIGGDGSKAGNGGMVTVENYGSIATTGDSARGIVVQSIGGGGGDGASSGGLVSVGGSGDGGGTGATVTVRHGGSITTEGADSTGIFAQSVGGGGGNGGSSGSVSAFVGVAVGGKGGAGGAGGNVNLTLQGQDANTASVIRTQGDRSNGVFAQSVGGGGGNGGGAVQVTGGFVGAVSVSVGGSGGSGGRGGTVTVSKGSGLSVVETGGDDSTGVFLQSVGGGGGNGGYSVSVAASGGPVSGSLGVSVGGSGGSGGVGGTVSVGSFTGAGDLVTTGLNSSILTRGDRSAGLIAQSVGGGGGNGGLSVSAAVAGGSIAGSVAVGVGGDGGGGGRGGNVSVGTQGNITTEGDFSSGMLVQSVGGGGGNGGGTISGALSGGAGAASIAVGVGGKGAVGGTGGEVTLATLDGTVSTSGESSTGITAQSIGGGGGNGGYSVTVGLAGAGVGAGSIAVGLGGSGGAASSGGKVKADLESDVVTAGANSGGILVQSVGGGGGNGGFNVAAGGAGAGQGSGTVSVGLGGSGGQGGAGGTVDASSAGTITTWGDRSSGFVAQSIGGGGGNGGFNVTGSVSGAGVGSGAVSVGLGGSGGSGGSASSVTASTSGDVNTGGSWSTGILAQSVGGGGGNGGFNVDVALSGAGTGSGAVGVGLGGSGAGGGAGSTVQLTVDNDVTTTGDHDSAGVVAQSVGGGGGNGGFNVTVAGSGAGTGSGAVGVGIGGRGGTASNAANVTNTMTGDVSTRGANSTGVLVQTVGGGGGNGGFNVSAAISGAGQGNAGISVGVGGAAGGGGDAGTLVKNTMSGNIQTEGDHSTGLLVQSVGGGGGNGAFNVTGAVSLSGGPGGAVGVGVGGFGGLGGDGKEVESSLTGNVTTSGESAHGVVMQSVGGGGGNGAVNVTGTVSLAKGPSGAVGAGVGGFGGSGGDSGSVTGSATGTVSTSGAGSHGVLAQSLGGGGGNGGLNVTGSLNLSTGGSGSGSLGIGGFGAGGGNSGDVTLTRVGSTSTGGAQSNAVTAQSIAGGGGNGGLNVSGAIGATTSGTAAAVALGLGGFGGGGGDSGDVVANVTGDVMARGTTEGGSNGVVAQSIGGGGGNGAINVSGGIAKGVTVTAGVGGFGGSGGTAGSVTANVTSDVTATGRRSRGILAQSVGGGGGDGGINVSGGIAVDPNGNKPSLAFGLGGFGGAGNASSDVSVTQKGQVFVEGTDSIGVVAQSIAGGGGNGGLNVAANVGVNDGFGVAVGIGGSGGLGADAGAVSLVSDGAISADGRTTDPEVAERTSGILAQSVGGGGGSAGLNVSGIVDIGKGSPIAVSVGGSGGGGGDAGAVTVTRGTNEAAALETYGDQATGLTAQSIGGGGGTAGMNFAASLSPLDPGSSKKVEAKIVVGGDGGAAGHGEATTVTHIGDIRTRGAQSVGLLAQSLGGGGGNANLNIGAGVNKDATGLELSVGGAPGAGGNGGMVTVDHRGNIATAGADSSAIFAQSVGGGGGDASVSTAFDFLSSHKLTLGIGRRGGSGATGGDVSVSSDGVLSTLGDRSVGLMAQSVGGGGGKSGSISVGLSSSPTQGNVQQSASVGVSVGLEGGVGGVGGTVDVDASGTITTRGEESHAIHAQSVGGGGGTGGGALNLTPNIAFKVRKEATSLTVGVGGKGGTGAVGGSVDVDSTAALTTEGDRAHGINAQSIGGGGGTGGYAAALGIQTQIKAEASSSNNIGVTVGGSGGTGGMGGEVQVQNSGSVITRGSSAIGVSAQSIGGGGGDGGITVNGSLGTSGKGSNLDVAVGGGGGQGGTGGQVSVTNGGVIQTQGEGSHGVRAQSIGGGGGDAGLVANIEISKSQTGAGWGSASLNIGGTGGTGGTGGQVSVTNEVGGQILTDGRGAHGVLAQSIGGGGGNGSSVISAKFSGGSQNAAFVGLNIGGQGGTGGHGGEVSVTNDSLIDTMGDGSHGVFAQSIGGGGGNGGLTLAANAVIASGGGTTPLLVVGGSGGKGADAGDVTVTNRGQIVTHGANAHGIHAQSIGGGGGNAGVGLALTSGIPSNVVANALSAVIGATGVQGGSGGLGGQVTVDHTGDITVFGDGSQAIKAESINGGGGGVVLDFDGITSLPGGAALPEIPGVGVPGVATDPVLTIRAGGQAQQNTDAGAVTVNATGTFGAAGDGSIGAGMQSIGGGGGTASLDLDLGTGSAADAMDRSAGDEANGRLALDLGLGGSDGVNNSGAAVVSTLTGDIITTGTNTPGVAIQSIGGGGGRGNFAVSGDLAGLGTVTLGLGGVNGTTERGGTVTLQRTGSVTTTGNGSHGILLQSIGGGGGSASLRIQQTATDRTLPISAFDPGLRRSFIDPGPTLVTLGSSGGTGLDGGDVSAALLGDVTTSGDGAVGLLVQSIGGGGGLAQLSGTTVLDVTLGGSGMASGDGGDITITNTGAVTTSGDRAHGVFLQSIGGGGGAVLSADGPVSMSASSANSGDGGNISLLQTGDITTSGNESFGLFAQSLGGGGGYADGYGALLAGGRGIGGAISIGLNGSVMATADTSTAVFLQSTGANGASNIDLTLDEGHSIVGGALGNAVSFEGGADNSFTSHGLVTTMAGEAGLTIVGTTGNDMISNFGQVVGSIDLGTGANGLDNAAGGWIVSGSTIALGDGNLFSNAGNFSAGGSGLIRTTNLTGDLAQTGTPTWWVDLDEVGVNDTLLASGSAALGSSVTLVELNALNTPTGTGDYTLLSAAGGLSGGEFRFGSYVGSGMPIGRTFDFATTSTDVLLTLRASTGDFIWGGETSDMWSSAFVNGVSNWTRDGARDYIYGTPGRASDVFFLRPDATVLGADFEVNSLTFKGSGAGTAVAHIAGSNSLTIFASGGRGLLVDGSAAGATVDVDLVLAGDQFWTNKSSGNLRITGDSITGPGKRLTVDGTGRTVIDAAIQTAWGSLSKQGTSRLRLNGANTYSGGTFVRGGILIGDAVSLQGTIVNHTRTMFDQRDDGVYRGNMRGRGMLIKHGHGTLYLGGVNSYSGGTWVRQGRLAGSSLSVQGDILNESAVLFQQPFVGVYSGVMSGAGSLGIEGRGALHMTGNSAGFRGPTTVYSGSLFVNGALGGSVVAWNGSVLGGSGIIPTATINGGATLAPGARPSALGALQVNGGVTFDPGSLYRIDTESYGPSDLTFATEALSVQGAAVRVDAGGDRRYQPINDYVIFHATGGIAGTFAEVTTSLSFLDPSLAYDANTVYLTLRRNDVDFTSFGTSGNQTSFANMLNGLVPFATGALADTVNAVFDLTDLEALAAMNSMSGILHQYVASSSLADAETFMHANLRRLEVVTEREDGAVRSNTQPRSFTSDGFSFTRRSAYPMTNMQGQGVRRGLWGSILGGVTSYEGNSVDTGARASGQGLVAGFDVAVSPSLTLGVSGGYSSPDLTLDDLADRMSASHQQVGVYGRFETRASHVDLAVNFGRRTNETSRSITDGVVSATAQASYRGETITSHVGWGYDFVLDNGLELGPELAFRFNRLNVDGFTEEGAGVLGLDVPGRTLDSQRSLLGARVGKTLRVGSEGRRIRLEGRGVWVHDFGDIDDVQLRFRGDPFTDGFTSVAPNQLRDSALVGANVGGDISSFMRFYGHLELLLSGPVTGVGGSAGVQAAW